MAKTDVRIWILYLLLSIGCNRIFSEPILFNINDMQRGLGQTEDGIRILTKDGKCHAVDSYNLQSDQKVLARRIESTGLYEHWSLVDDKALSYRCDLRIQQDSLIHVKFENYSFDIGYDNVDCFIQKVDENTIFQYSTGWNYDSTFKACVIEIYKDSNGWPCNGIIRCGK
jgi:hypothetical protein